MTQQNKICTCFLFPPNFSLSLSLLSKSLSSLTFFLLYLYSLSTPSSSLNSLILSLSLFHFSSLTFSLLSLFPPFHFPLPLPALIIFPLSLSLSLPYLSLFSPFHFTFFSRTHSLSLFYKNIQFPTWYWTFPTFVSSPISSTEMIQKSMEDIFSPPLPPPLVPFSQGRISGTHSQSTITCEMTSGAVYSTWSSCCLR